ALPSCASFRIAPASVHLPIHRLTANPATSGSAASPRAIGPVPKLATMSRAPVAAASQTTLTSTVRRVRRMANRDRNRRIGAPWRHASGAMVNQIYMMRPRRNKSVTGPGCLEQLDVHRPYQQPRAPHHRQFLARDAGAGGAVEPLDEGPP